MQLLLDSNIGLHFCYQIMPSHWVLHALGYGHLMVEVFGDWTPLRFAICLLLTQTSIILRLNDCPIFPCVITGKIGTGIFFPCSYIFWVSVLFRFYFNHLSNTNGHYPNRLSSSDSMKKELKFWDSVEMVQALHHQ